MTKTLEQEITDQFPQYTKYLKELIGVHTVYTDTEGIKLALKNCQDIFSSLLPDYDWSQDKEDNLIGVPQKLDSSKHLMYLSAHIDTVDANADDWDPKFSPFTAFEDEESIVGRGSSDCKAGVAYQLWLASLLSNQTLDLPNIVFTISSREEQGGQSASAIGVEIGKTLPVATPTYILVLENTVRAESPVVLEVNNGQRNSFGVRVEGTITEIGNFLNKSDHLWNPTSIAPIDDVEEGDWDQLHQDGGHAATTGRDKNQLFTLLTSDSDQVILLRAGFPETISAVPAVISTQPTTKDMKHWAIFDLRSTASRANLDIELEKSGLSYDFVKSLEAGYDVADKLEADSLFQLLLDCQTDQLKIKIEPNAGATDAGTIYNACDSRFREHLIPLIAGPGSRSQRTKTPPRLTHGVNETFDKRSGFHAVLYLTTLTNSLLTTEN